MGKYLIGSPKKGFCITLIWWRMLDENPAYPKAVGKLKKGILPPDCKLRPLKYLNNLRVRYAHARPSLY